MATDRTSGRSEQSDRQRRLAEALRANLRRRKAQAKARRGQDSDDPAESDGSGGSTD